MVLEPRDGVGRRVTAVDDLARDGQVGAAQDRVVPGLEP
jgi:hypothetical protein